MHLIALHDKAGSSNPLGTNGTADRLPFAPYFIFKDLITIFMFIFVLSLFVFFMPNVLGDTDNYIPANPMQTPAAINIGILYLLTPVLGKSMNYSDKGIIEDEINLNKENNVDSENNLYLNNKEIINETQKGFITINNKKQEVTKLELLNLIESTKENIIKNNSPCLNETKFLKEFRELVNGVFQAEGHIGGYFPSASTITFRPLVYISQNARDSSLEFLVILWLILDKNFKFVIYQNEPSKYFHIRLLSRD
jgi:hypothetical protein